MKSIKGNGRGRFEASIQSVQLLSGHTVPVYSTNTVC